MIERHTIQIDTPANTSGLDRTAAALLANARAVDTLAARARDAAPAMERSITAMDRLKTVAAGLGAGLAVGAFAGMVSAGAKFEDQLRTINTVAGVTDTRLDEIGAGIRQLATETGKPLADLTQGFYDLVSAGIDEAEAMDVLRDSTTLAIGAIATTSQSVDLLTSTLNAYGFATTESARVTDIWAQTVNDGKVTAAQLSGAIAQIAPIASNAGIEIEEVAAGFARLTATGVPASEAATNMAQAIVALITPNEALAAVQDRVGINFAELARTEGLQVALQRLRDATAGNEEAFAAALGRVQAYQFALAATGENAADFTAQLGKIEAAATTGGVAVGQMAERQKSAAEQGRILAAQIRDLALTIGGPFVDGLGPAVTAVGELGLGFSGLTRAGAGIGAVLGAIGTYLTGTAATATAAAAATTAQGTALAIVGMQGRAAILGLVPVAAANTGVATTATAASVATNAFSATLRLIPIVAIVAGVVQMADEFGRLTRALDILGMDEGPARQLAAWQELRTRLADGSAAARDADAAIAALKAEMAELTTVTETQYQENTRLIGAWNRTRPAALDAAGGIKAIPTALDAAGISTFRAAERFDELVEGLAGLPFRVQRTIPAWRATLGLLPKYAWDMVPPTLDAAYATALAYRDGIASGRSDIAEAFEDIVRDQAASYSVQQQLADIGSILVSDKLRVGLASKNPQIAADYKVLSLALVKQLNALGLTFYGLGQQAATNLWRGFQQFSQTRKEGFREQFPGLIEAAGTIVDPLNNLGAWTAAITAAAGPIPVVTADTKAWDDILGRLGVDLDEGTKKTTKNTGAAREAAAGAKEQADALKGPLKDALRTARDGAENYFRLIHERNLQAIDDAYERTAEEVRLSRERIAQHLDEVRQKADAPVTAAEQAQRLIEDQRRARDLQESLADAQARVAEASAGRLNTTTGAYEVDQGAVDSANRAVRSAQEAIQSFDAAAHIAGLRAAANETIRLAEEEAKRLEGVEAKKLEDAEATRKTAKAAEEERFRLQKEEFARAWEVLERELETGKLKHTEVHAKITALYKGFGLDYKTAAANLGKAIADGLRSEMLNVESAAKDLAGAIAKYLAVKSPTEAGPLAVDHRKWGATLIREMYEGARAESGRQEAAVVTIASAFADQAAASVRPAYAGGLDPTRAAPATGSAPVVVEVHYHAEGGVHLADRRAVDGFMEQVGDALTAPDGILARRGVTLGGG